MSAMREAAEQLHHAHAGRPMRMQVPQRPDLLQQTGSSASKPLRALQGQLCPWPCVSKALTPPARMQALSRHDECKRVLINGFRPIKERTQNRKVKHTFWPMYVCWRFMILMATSGLEGCKVSSASATCRAGHPCRVTLFCVDEVELLPPSMERYFLHQTVCSSQAAVHLTHDSPCKLQQRKRRDRFPLQLLT